MQDRSSLPFKTMTLDRRQATSSYATSNVQTKTINPVGSQEHLSKVSYVVTKPSAESQLQQKLQIIERPLEARSESKNNMMRLSTQNPPTTAYQTRAPVVSARVNPGSTNSSFIAQKKLSNNENFAQTATARMATNNSLAFPEKKNLMTLNQNPSTLVNVYEPNLSSSFTNRPSQPAQRQNLLHGSSIVKGQLDNAKRYEARKIESSASPLRIKGESTYHKISFPAKN